MDNSELSLSPVTPKGEKYEETKGSGKVVKKNRPAIELNKNDITNSSVETEKATYDSKPIPT